MLFTPWSVKEAGKEAGGEAWEGAGAGAGAKLPPPGPFLPLSLHPTGPPGPVTEPVHLSASHAGTGQAGGPQSTG